MQSSCVFTYDYNRITVNNQGIKTEYIKSALDKIKKGLFSVILKMSKNGATAEQIWQYQMEEIRRVYALKKIRKAIKRCKETLTYAFKQITIAINKGTSKEYRSTSRGKSSDAKRTSSGDSGDPDPDQPPRHCYLNPSSKTPKHCIKQNSFTVSRRLASCQWLMAQGVA